MTLMIVSVGPLGGSSGNRMAELALAVTRPANIGNCDDVYCARRLSVEGDWIEAVRKALAKGRPPKLPKAPEPGILSQLGPIGGEK